MQELENKEMLYSEIFGNGLEISVIDQSRKIAGDRWLVKIKCTVESRRQTNTPQSSSSQGRIQEQKSGLTEDREGVLKVFFRERNFVDSEERESVVAELLEQLKSTVLPYLRSDSALQKLLATKGDPEKEQSDQADAENRFAHLDREEGPADFSSLFREK